MKARGRPNTKRMKHYVAKTTPDQVSRKFFGIFDYTWQDAISKWEKSWVEKIKLKYPDGELQFYRFVEEEPDFSRPRGAIFTLKVRQK